jgi:hypothetical protein
MENSHHRQVSLVDLQTIFNAECLDTCMLLIKPKFACLAPVISAIKPKAKYRFHAAAILLFYVPQNMNIDRTCIFFEAMLTGPYIIGACVADCRK